MYPSAKPKMTMKTRSPERLLSEATEHTFLDNVGYNNYIGTLETEPDGRKTDKTIQSARVKPDFGKMISSFSKLKIKKASVSEKPPLFENFQIAKSLGIKTKKKFDSYNPFIQSLLSLNWIVLYQDL